MRLNHAPETETLTVCLSPAQAAALRAYANHFDLQGPTAGILPLFLASALAFQKQLYPVVKQWVAYCESEGLEPAIETLETMCFKPHPAK